MHNRGMSLRLFAIPETAMEEYSRQTFQNWTCEEDKHYRMDHGSLQQQPAVPVQMERFWTRQSFSKHKIFKIAGLPTWLMCRRTFCLVYHPTNGQIIQNLKLLPG